MLYRAEFKHSVMHLVKNWFLIRKSMYFILIKDIFFCEKKKDILVKYQCVNKRIGDTISLTEFMSSPLKHATHPDQIFQIGMELEKQQNNLKTIPSHHENKEEMKPHLNRFKKIFYSPGEEKK